MTVKDGFKFGIGFILAGNAFTIISDLCSEKSEIRKAWSRCVSACKVDDKPAKPANYASVTINNHLDTADN